VNPPIVIQARMGSRRLPGKVLAELSGRTVLEYVIQRCKLSGYASAVMVATTTLPRDDPVVDLCERLNTRVYRGSEDDVLSRYLGASRTLDATHLVRITADCPLIDPVVIDDVISICRKTPADYVYIQDYPNGLGDAELLAVSALERSVAETTSNDSYYREHVMTYMVEHPEKFTLKIVDARAPFRKPEIHLSVDEPADLEIVRKICAFFYPRFDFGMEEILTFLDDNPDLAQLSRRRWEKQ
jgi:spore coat polysaccharide biosynthesis protein SpsF